MTYWYQPPHDKLSEYIRTVLVVDVSMQGDNPKVPLVVAGMPAVFVQLNACGLPEEVVITLFGSPVPADFSLSDRHAITIAYFFKPFALAALFDLPARQVAKGPINVDQWNESESAQLKARLSQAHTPAALLGVLEEFFIGLLSRHHHACDVIRKATDRILYDPASDVLSQLPGQLHLTLRTFQRMFKKYVGISPTEYRRICQFQQSFQQVRTRQFEKLSDVAVDNGFADQSHFVRSFREFSQTTPGKYLDEGLQPK